MEIEAHDSGTVSENVTILMRSYLSLHHIIAAAHYTKLCEDFEKSYDGKFSFEKLAEHRAYAMGGILCSVAFLEASLNELIEDLDDGHGEYAKNLNSTTQHLIATVMKNPTVAKTSTLEKYQTVLLLANQPRFETGKQPYQDISLLIDLRNMLIHYRPETLVADPTDNPSGNTDHEKLTKKLRAKFTPNPLVKGNNPFFPDYCLSQGCAEWATRSSIAFAKEFFLRMGLTTIFNASHHWLKPYL